MSRVVGRIEHRPALTPIMDLTEARMVVRDASATWKTVCEASGLLSSCEETTFEDLLACLRHRGLPAEMAACALYVRTRRSRADGSPLSLVLAHDDWATYLRSHGMIPGP